MEFNEGNIIILSGNHNLCNVIMKCIIKNTLKWIEIEIDHFYRDKNGNNNIFHRDVPLVLV